jgi:CheY-like chemotaxis protein
VAKILRGKLSLKTAPVDLRWVIEGAIDTVQTAANAKNILLHPVLEPVGPICGDSTRLQQIIWNLLSNAIKFTPEHGRVEIQLQQVDHHAHIVVSDTGRGIAPTFLPYIFESFRQEDASTTRTFGGLGLGLAIVYYLVEAHGGTIWADSPGEGQGATFTVQLPLMAAGQVQPEPPTKPDTSDGMDLAGLRILAVDDEPDARDLITELLSQFGAEMLTVASANEALDQFESFQPNVLVCDIGMPEVDGYTLLQQIRTLSPEQGGQIPAIALTAYAREEDRQTVLRRGFQHHIPKPLDPETLVSTLIELIENK